VSLDLSPPKEIGEALTQLAAILAVFDASMTASHVLTEKEQQIAPVLAAILDPLLGCASACAGHMDRSAQETMQINVLGNVQTVLKKYRFARSRSETLALRLQSHLDTLTALQAAAVLYKTGLAEKLVAVDACLTNSQPSPLSQSPGMSSEELRPTLQAFFGSMLALSSLPDCDRILDARLRQQCREAVGATIAAKYRVLHTAISDPRAGYDNAAGLLTHSPDMVETLLEAGGPK
jgi:hypothetical protein